jgi:hypothetical protein
LKMGRVSLFAHAPPIFTLPAVIGMASLCHNAPSFSVYLGSQNLFFSFLAWSGLEPQF